MYHIGTYMADPIPLRPRPIQWDRLRADQAERIIHERAKNSDNVVVIGPPAERMEERSIFRPDLDRILRTGMVMDRPKRATDKSGQLAWEAVVVKRLKGGRDAAAVTIILREERLIVKTVEWVDEQ